LVLHLYNSFSRTLFQAAQTLDAFFLIDDKLAVSFADGFFGAYLCAGTTLDAIVSDYDHVMKVS
jgi:hypothetical protein